jgi:hypothetical protein
LDVFALVGILALSLAVGLLAGWTVLKLVIVAMTRHRTPAYFEPQPVALSDELLHERHTAWRPLSSALISAWDQTRLDRVSTEGVRRRRRGVPPATV